LGASLVTRIGPWSTLAKVRLFGRDKLTEDYRQYSPEYHAGVPKYQFLYIPHPIANLSEQDLERQADELLESVVSLITASIG
jgi:hypothetical protein